MAGRKTTQRELAWFGRDGDPPPPAFTLLEGDDAVRVRALLAERLGGASMAGLDLVRELFARAEVAGRLTEGEPIDFEALLGAPSAPRSNGALLAWDPLETFFKVGFADFLAALPHLFELEVFDLLVLDEELRWAVFLMHHGEARRLRPIAPA